VKDKNENNDYYCKEKNPHFVDLSKFCVSAVYDSQIFETYYKKAQ
jgi:hypothetical protein